MAAFETYAHNYRFMKLTREDGILHAALHTDGGPLRWGLDAQAECAQAFADIGADRENRLVILSGTGDEFSGPRLDPNAPFFHGAQLTPRAWQLARQLAQKSDMLLRYTRSVLTFPLRRLMDDGMPFYLAMEALSTLDKGHGGQGGQACS